MRLAVSLLLAMALAPIVSVATGHAQDGAVYVVSYIDVAPTARAATAGALRQLATASRKDDATCVRGLQRTGAVEPVCDRGDLEESKQAYEAHAAAAHSKEFRDKIKPQLISAIDDRLHSGLEVGGAALNPGRGTIFVVTHVDFRRRARTSASRCSRRWSKPVATKPVSVRFEVYQQANRPNHFSVVEIWKDQRAYDAHITAPHTRTFRDQLTPMSGALYDERLYKAI